MAGRGRRGRGGGGGRGTGRAFKAGSGQSWRSRAAVGARAGVRLFMFRSGPLKCFPRRRSQSLWRLPLFSSSPALPPPRPLVLPSPRRGGPSPGTARAATFSPLRPRAGGRTWVRARTGSCHFQKKDKTGSRGASSSAGVCKGSSQAGTTTLGFCVVYLLAGVVPTTPFPVKHGGRGQVGT